MQRWKIYGGTDPRELPTYPLVEAAGYLRMPVATLRTWVAGRQYPTRGGPRDFVPLITLPHPRTLVLSYINLVEAHVLRCMRFGHRIKLRKVRAGIDYLREEFRSPHPLATHDFLTDGLDLLVTQFDQLINVSKYGQMALRDVLEAFLLRIEREDSGFPITLYPLPSYERIDQAAGQPRPVAVSPWVAFGQPVVPKSGVKAEALFSRWTAGETISELSEDYALEPNKLEAAIQWYASTQQKAA
jgi:uncharacterized protein (DUF433 family)